MADRDSQNSPHHGKDILYRAAHAARTSVFVADDLSAALAPRSDVRLSDRMLSFSRQFLQSIISNIETEICKLAIEHFDVTDETLAAIATSDRVHSYQLLGSAGILDDHSLLEHVFVQAQKIELSSRLVQKISRTELENILTRYLNHSDKAIADAAMEFLVAQGREGTTSDTVLATRESLPAEVLHGLIWPIGAALTKLAGAGESQIIAAVQRILAEHDEGQSAARCAERLGQLISASDDPEIQNPHPLLDGVELFVARLAIMARLNIGQVYTFTAEERMARLVVTLRALGFEPQAALSLHAALDGNGEALTAATYNEIDSQHALYMLQVWTRDPAYQAARHAMENPGAGQSGR